MNFDPIPILQVLKRHQVKFVLIGGLAASAYGSPMVTLDLDICYDRSDDNLDRLAEALQELEARLRGAPEDLKFVPDAHALRMGDHLTFATSLGPLDCLGTPRGTQGYEELEANASRLDLDGMEILMASLEDLIRMKRRAARPKDLEAVEILMEIRDRN